MFKKTELTICLAIGLFLPISTFCFDISRLSSFDDNGLGWEILLIFIGTVAIMNYISGKKKNKQVATDFLKSVLPTLYDEFAVIGEKHHETVKKPVGEDKVNLNFEIISFMNVTLV